MPPKKLKPTDCDVCCRRIIDSKEEALQCEGGCGLWFHRYCAGVSVSYFTELSNSSEPFVCYACYQRSQLAITKQLRNEVTHLKGEITKLSEQLAKLTTTVSRPCSSSTANKSTSSANNSPTYASALKQPTISIPPAQSGDKTKPNNSVNKKFSIVLYGPSECPKGSPRHERISHDTSLAGNIVKSICPDINDYAISDCLRIGKYSESRARPLLVKFVRSCDVVAVLSTGADCQKLITQIFL